MNQAAEEQEPESEYKSPRKPGTWDQSAAQEAGRKGGTVSGQVRQQKARRKAEAAYAADRAMRTFEEEAEEMARIVLRAAKGQGEFIDLNPKDRAQYALKALEFGLGRPRQGQPKEKERTQEPGLSFKASPQGDFGVRSEDAVQVPEAAQVDARQPSDDGDAVGA